MSSVWLLLVDDVDVDDLARWLDKRRRRGKRRREVVDARRRAQFVKADAARRAAYLEEVTR